MDQTKFCRHNIQRSKLHVGVDYSESSLRVEESTDRLHSRREASWSLLQAAPVLHCVRGQEVAAGSMLTIFGILMLVLWLLDNAFHRPSGSGIHLLAMVASVCFVAEFVRSRAVAFRENREPQQSKTAPEPAEQAKEVSPSLTSSSRTSISAS
jgi:hypothetical protein